MNRNISHRGRREHREKETWIARINTDEHCLFATEVTEKKEND